MVTMCSDHYKSASLKDGFLTRNSPRIRIQQEKHAADFVQPHVYDRLTRRLKPNEDFIKLYPTQAKQYYSGEELRKAGLGKVAAFVEAEKKEIKEHRANLDKNVDKTGDISKSLKKIIK